MTNQPYRVALLTDPVEVRAFLNVDRSRHAYMIGDLSAPYWSPEIFYGAYSAHDSALRAVVLVYKPIDPPPLISAGEPEAVAAIFAALIECSIVDRVMYHALPDHMPALETYFALTGEATAMWRLAIVRDHFTPSASSAESLRRLTGSDVAIVQAVFDSGHADEFMDSRPHITPGLLDNGIFYGAFALSDKGRAPILAAVAGTHIVAPDDRIATVGYVFTRPDQRGRGFATLATAGVTDHLFSAGMDLVTLNVKQDNTPAIRAYQRLGYERHNWLYEGFADRKR